MGARSAWKYTTPLILVVAFLAGMVVLPGDSGAAPPVVKTVPWIATNPLIPHDTYAGKAIRLKGTCDQQGSNLTWTWDFGDGSPVATGTVTNKYVIEASHTYAGPVGTIWTATLTVTNTSTGETGSKHYYVQMREKTLPVEVNVAIDEGLWYLHKTQWRGALSGAEVGHWNTCPSGTCYATDTSYYAVTPSNVHAFEVNGHLETGSADNPYTETVQRGMRRIFQMLSCSAPAGITSQTNGLGTFNPDSNGNKYAVFVNDSYPYYQGGMFMDAIIASGTPNAVTTTGTAASGDNPGILGRTYKDIVQDMVDGYSWAQYDGTAGGGWRYNANEAPDNSACQWAAIGLIAAERTWGVDVIGPTGIVVPQIVKNWNKTWLAYSQHTSGYFGYTSTSPASGWGTMAVTPSGMVQLAMDGIGRGDTANPPWAAGRHPWDEAETYMCNNFCNSGNPDTAVRDYYYGLFSFTKAMMLHTRAGGTHEPITILKSTTNPANDIDWYGADRTTNGTDRCDGVARTLVGDQNAAGYWRGNNNDSRQYPYETSYAIIMLNRTLFEAGQPVAVASVVPNPAVAGQTITLDGSASFHQDPTRNIDSWEWDLNNDGTYDVSGPIVTASWPALGNYPVKLRVTDDGTPEKSATTVVTVRVTIPPLAPTAEAGGPYIFCIGQDPWYLDGSKSVNPDEGQSEPGRPGDTIQTYAWELDGDGDFNDAFGAKPDVTAYYAAKGLGHYLVQLKVTDTTATSFPSSGQPNLTSPPDSAEVSVKAQDDDACTCIRYLAARAKATKIQLTWKHVDVTKYPAWHHYNIYRSTTAGGPYVKIGTTTSTYSTYLDSGLTIGTTYYYVVRAAKLSGAEICQSNQAWATATAR